MAPRRTPSTTNASSESTSSGVVTLLIPPLEKDRRKDEIFSAFVLILFAYPGYFSMTNPMPRTIFGVVSKASLV